MILPGLGRAKEVEAGPGLHQTENGPEVEPEMPAWVLKLPQDLGPVAPGRGLI